MDNARHDKPISDVMRTPGDEKYRVLATRGAETFLMLDGGTGDDFVYAVDGAADKVDCGPGDDAASVDQSDRVVGCESL